MSDEFFHDNENENMKNAAENNFGKENNTCNDINNYNQQEESPKTEPGSSSAYSFWAEQVAASSPNQNKDPEPQRYYGDVIEEKQPYTQNGAPYNNGTYNNGTCNNGNAAYNSHVFDMSSDTGKKTSKPGFIKKAVKFLAGAAVFGLVAGAAFLGFNMVYYKLNPDAVPITISLGNSDGFTGFKLNFNSNTKIASTTVSKDTIQQKTDVTDVITATMPSIVTITTTYKQAYDWFGQQLDQENQGGGSGIIVGKNDKELLIATNNHVVEGADPIKVKFIDGTEAEAIIKGTDSVADLAVISIDLSSIKEATLGKIKIAKLGDSDSTKVGEMAIAIGNALGYGQSTTVGYISAKDRKVQVDDKTMVLLQTDAAINPGNSGGALLNLKGEVIGINTVKYADSEVEGMGFAIPITRATPIINELMSREILAANEKGYLGVYIEDVTEEIASTYNWPVGVFVKSTVEGGSADKAGIIAGDIITKVNDTEITAKTQLKEKVTSYRAGTKITVNVKRSEDGKFVDKQIQVTLGKSPDTDNQ